MSIIISVKNILFSRGGETMNRKTRIYLTILFEELYACYIKRDYKTAHNIYDEIMGFCCALNCAEIITEEEHMIYTCEAFRIYSR